MCLLLIPAPGWSPQQPCPVWTGYLSFTVTPRKTTAFRGQGPIPVPCLLINLPIVQAPVYPAWEKKSEFLETCLRRTEVLLQGGTPRISPAQK